MLVFSPLYAISLGMTNHIAMLFCFVFTMEYLNSNLSVPSFSN